jgi:hypothetical protein
MQELVRILSDYPLAAIAVCFAALLLIYFLFKCLIKLALILAIVAVAIGGYYYFREPREPANLREVVERTRIETNRAIEKGKEAVEKGREIVDKGKEAIEKGREMVDKGKAALDAGIEKGKEVVDRGKGTADEVGKILGGERETGKK